MAHPLTRWLRIAFCNLAIVALLGAVMRYKIVFSLPWINQKYLLHAHSHFAFSGWITQILMAFLVMHLYKNGQTGAFKRYNRLLYANLLISYSMLVSFVAQGYALLSIVFSTLSIFTFYIFGYRYWRDLQHSNTNASTRLWFKTAIVFNILSSLGAFTLAFLMATHNRSPERMLTAVYFFLHFQYNGWFFFCCMGLLNQRLVQAAASERQLRLAWLLTASACIPSWFLSTPWLHLPVILRSIIILSIIAQTSGWLLILHTIKGRQPAIVKTTSPLIRTLFLLCATAISIKLLLQAFTLFPQLSKLAFGFRPIVIGYLHLVLLGIITLFILAYSLSTGYHPINRATSIGIKAFTAGIIANEALLMTQGLADIAYIPLPAINYWLLAVAFVMLAALHTISMAWLFNSYDPAHKIYRDAKGNL